MVEQSRNRPHRRCPGALDRDTQADYLREFRQGHQVNPASREVVYAPFRAIDVAGNKSKYSNAIIANVGSTTNYY